MTRKTFSNTALRILLTFTLAFPVQTLAYNKSWDQGHQSTDPDDGDKGCENPDECGPKECSPDSTACPVYVKTGRLEKMFIDLSVPGVGPLLTIVRTYQSLDWASSLFGRHWVFNLGRRIAVIRSKEGGKRVLVHRQGGEINLFREHEDGTLELLNSYGVPYELTKQPDGTYVISERSGSVQHINSEGKTLSIYDKNGNKLSFTYDSVGCLSRITNASGNYMDFQLGPNGKIASISDNLGRTVNYSYDTNGNLTSSTDPLGNTTQYLYDSENRLIRVIDPLGNTVFSVTYDGFQPSRIQTFSEKGETWTFTYYNGYTVKTDLSGNTWTYYYNDLGLIERTIDPLGNNTRKLHNQVTSTSIDWQEDANGNRTTYTYDADDNITSITDPLGSTWQYTYIAGSDRVETEINPMGIVTRYEYDSNGNRTKIVEAVGTALQRQTVFTYDTYGNMLSITDPMGAITRYSYDSFGNTLEVTNAIGNTTRYTYDGLGNRTSAIDPLGNTTTFSYDDLGHLTSASDPLGNAIQMTYDAANHMSSVTAPSGGTTTYSYNSYGHLVQVTDLLGNSTSYEYDSMDRRTKTQDANGNETFYTYNANGHVISETDAQGHTTTYGYDAVGNLTSIIDAKGNTTTFVFDTVGRPVRTGYPDGTWEEVTYNGVGKITTKKDRMGRTTTLTYDVLGRLVSKSYPDDSQVAFTYDIVDNLTSASNSSAMLAFNYDSMGKCLSETNTTWGMTVSYAYDSLGRLSVLTSPNARITSFTYDQASRLTAISDSSMGSVAFACDSSGRLVSKVLPNGTLTNYSYDNAGRVVAVEHTRSGGGVFMNMDYTLDAVGNRVTMTDDVGTHNYTYDAVYQLIDATHSNPSVNPNENYSYDPVGNRITSHLSSSYLYDTCNRLTEDEQFTYSYDGNGNLTSRTSKSDSSVTQYSYDFENHLIEVTMPDGTNSTYSYDPIGRRIVKSISGSPTARFIYSREGIVCQCDDTGAITSSYVYMPRTGWPLMACRDGVTLFYHEDAIGSIRALTTGVGDIAARYHYDSFGQVTSQQGAPLETYAFHGKELDHESLLYNHDLRYYSPSIGRFISPDSVWTDNLYRYAANNPTTYIEVGGQSPATIVAVIIALEAVWVAACSSNAYERAFKAFPGNQPDIDKKRHCYANCFLNRCLVSQPAVAFFLGIAYELLNPNYGWKDAVRDIHANVHGIVYSFTFSSCEDKCKDYCPMPKW